MSRKRVVVVVCALAATSSSLAANWITVWSATGGYNLQQAARTVEITSAGTFKIKATGDEVLGLGDINSITVAANVTGRVEVSVITENGDPGAYEVRRIDLSNAEEGVVHDVWCMELGADGPTLASDVDYWLTAENAVLGNITLDGLSGKLDVGSLQDLTVTGDGPSRQATGQVVVGSNYAGTMSIGIGINGIWVGSLTGDIDVAGLGTFSCYGGCTGAVIVEDGPSAGAYFGGTLGGTGHARFGSVPQVWVQQIIADPWLPIPDLDGVLEVLGDLGYLKVEGYVDGGEIHVYGDCGAIDVTQAFDGVLEVTGALDGVFQTFNGTCAGTVTLGSVTANGRLAVGPLDENAVVPANLDAVVHVLGDVTVGSAPAIRVFRYLNGKILIDGALLGDLETDAIAIRGELLNPDACVVIDWNGYDGDAWVPGRVRIGGSVSSNNDPDAHVWHINCCKGDMTNDGLVNFTDVDPFVAALQCCRSNPNNPAAAIACFEAQYTGRGGSGIFHGDITGDGTITFADIDPFVALIPSTCAPCGQPLQGGGEQMEMMMMEGGALGGQAALADAIAAAVDSGAGPAGPEYWESVFNSFGEQ